MHKLTSVYLLMLNNMLSIEGQLIKGLPRLQEHAANPELRNELAMHQDEAQAGKMRLEEILQHHGVPFTNEHDAAFETMLGDMLLQLSLIDDQNVKDAYIIASIKTLEYHQLSRYETLMDWARELGDDLGMELLHETQKEKRENSKKLVSIAQGGLFTMGINEQAVITEDSETTDRS